MPAAGRGEPLTTDRPLAGVQVLEVCTSLAGYSTTRLLADLGAEVVQVPAPGGALDKSDPVRVWADRGKKVGDAAFSTGQGVAAVRRLADEAHVFVSDLPPGRLEPLGLDTVTLSARNPRLVRVWMPPFGREGRWSSLGPDPLLLAAVSGFADHHPATEDRPIAPVVPTFCYLHGALGAAAGVAGLVGLQRGGSACAVTVSGLHAMGAALATLMAKGVDQQTLISAGRSPRGAPFFRLYQGGDGNWFYLAALSPDIFFRALDLLGRMDVMVRDDVGGDFARLVVPEVASEVNGEMEKTFSARPAAHWVEALQRAGVPAAPVWTREAWTASEVGSAATPLVEEVHPEVGTVTVPSTPIAIEPSGSVPARVGADAPRAPDSPPLEGLRVVDISTFLAGPFAAGLLGDFGADVVKVEPVGGDPYRVYSVSHAVANQHKRVAALDLRDEGGRSALLRLLATADVMVDNVQEASLERLGLGTEVLLRSNRGLVRASLSAFGTGHAWSAVPGFDPVLQSMTGLAAAQGGAGAPSPSSAPVVDVAAGTLTALGALACIFSRGRTGHVRRVRTSLAAAAVFVQSAEMTGFASRPRAATGGADFVGPHPWLRYHRTSDGWIAVAARTEAQRERFAVLVASSDPAEVEGVMAGEETIRWLDQLNRLGIPAAAVLSRAVGIEDPYLTANGFSCELQVPDVGRFRVVRSYADWQGCRRPPVRTARVGAHTAEVLVEAGMSQEEISRLSGPGRQARGAAVDAIMRGSGTAPPRTAPPRR